MLLLILTLLFSTAVAKPEGQIIWESQCQRCHQPGSSKPLSYLKQKYKGNPQGIEEMAKVCPWGKGLSEMEIELVSKWISGD